MNFLGIKNGVTRPIAGLRKRGDIENVLDIATADCNYAISAIPTCRIMMPPESLNEIPTLQDDTVYEVFVKDLKGQDMILFTGYISGESGRISGNQISAGVSMVHLARDMDQMRLTAPSMHPASVVDFNYVYRTSGTSNLASSAGFNFGAEIFFKAGEGKLPEQIEKGIVAILKKAVSLNKQGVGGGAGLKVESLDPAIKLLDTLTYRNGNIREVISNPLQDPSNIDNSINGWCRSRITQSYNSMRSVWDTLVSVFAEMSLIMTCMPDGTIQVEADCSGFEAPKGNYLGPDYIGGFDLNSTLQRNVKEINLVSRHIRSNVAGAPGAAGILVTYPIPKPTSGVSGAAEAAAAAASIGGSLAFQLPGWLNPIASTGGGAGILEAQQAYAKSVYYHERNKFRGMTVTGPLAPGIIPGTVALVTPWSKIRMVTTGDFANFLAKTYEGYCYQVSHHVNVGARVVQTTATFRNVSDSATGETITEHPIFDDVTPRVWD